MKTNLQALVNALDATYRRAAKDGETDTAELSRLWQQYRDHNDGDALARFANLAVNVLDEVDRLRAGGKAARSIHVAYHDDTEGDLATLRARVTEDEYRDETGRVLDAIRTVATTALNASGTLAQDVLRPTTDRALEGKNDE